MSGCWAWQLLVLRHQAAAFLNFVDRPQVALHFGRHYREVTGRRENFHELSAAVSFAGDPEGWVVLPEIDWHGVGAEGLPPALDVLREE